MSSAQYRRDAETSPGNLKFSSVERAMLCERPIPDSSMPPYHTGMPRSCAALWIAIASLKPPARPSLMLMMRQDSISIAANASRRFRIDSSRQIGVSRRFCNIE